MSNCRCSRCRRRKARKAARSPGAEKTHGGAAQETIAVSIDDAEAIRPPARRRADHIPLGIALMLGATVMYAGSTALSKWQVASYSFAEVLFFRTAVSLVVCAALILPRTGITVFRTKRLRDHAARSADADGGAEPDPDRAQPDAARRRHGDQFFGAAVCHAVRRAVAQGESRPGARRQRSPSAFAACCWSPRPAPTASASARCSRSATRCSTAASPRRCAA